MNVVIDVEDPQWQAVEGLVELAERAVAKALPPDLAHHCITILFTSDDEVCALNRDWRGMDKPTNVLSFPVAEGSPQPPDEAPSLGDIALAYGVVAREAAAQHKTMAHHTTHLIVHGTLHLLGYDHENDADAAEMESHEAALLHELGIADPYLT